MSPTILKRELFEQVTGDLHEKTLTLFDNSNFEHKIIIFK